MIFRRIYFLLGVLTGALLALLFMRDALAELKKLRELDAARMAFNTEMEAELDAYNLKRAQRNLSRRDER